MQSLTIAPLLLFIFADTGSVLSAPGVRVSEIHAVLPPPDPVNVLESDTTLMAQLNYSAFALWNANFSSETEAMEICNQYVNTLEARSPHARGDCYVKYKCSFDYNRFPAIMISATCTNSFCYSRSENVEGKRVPVIGDCMPVQHLIIVLKYYRDVQEEIAPYSNAAASPQLSDLGIDLTKNVVDVGSGTQTSRTNPSGQWRRQPTMVTENCKCSDD